MMKRLIIKWRFWLLMKTMNKKIRELKMLYNQQQRNIDAVRQLLVEAAGKE